MHFHFSFKWNFQTSQISFSSAMLSVNASLAIYQEVQVGEKSGQRFWKTIKFGEFGALRMIFILQKWRFEVYSTRVSSSASRTWFWVINYDDIIDCIAGFLKKLNQIILIRFWRSVIVQKNINSSICGFGNRKSRCGQIGINQNDYWFHSINMYFLNYFYKNI